MRKFIVTLLLLSAIFCGGYKLFYTEQKPVAPKPPVITEGELTRFLHTWSEYLDNPVSKKSTAQLSLIKNGQVPERTALWLQERNWNPEHFFFLEQRLKAVVRSIYFQKHSKKVIELLHSDLKTERDRVILDNIQSLITLQAKNFNVENVSPAEMQMIEENADNINDVLEGKTKL